MVTQGSVGLLASYSYQHRLMVFMDRETVAVLQAERVKPMAAAVQKDLGEFWQTAGHARALLQAIVQLYLPLTVQLCVCKMLSLMSISIDDIYQMRIHGSHTCLPR